MLRLFLTSREQKKENKKCPEPESNQRHEDFQSSALPTELSGHLINIEVFVSFVSYSLSTIVILQQDKRKVKHFFEKNLTFFEGVFFAPIHTI